MNSIALSAKADEDMTEIYRYSFERFGEEAADAYLSGLSERFRLLAERPSLGKRVDQVRAGYLRYEYSNHSIYYRRSDDGIVIMRVLHKSMDADQHL